MERQYLTRVSVAVLFSMFLCSAVQADVLSGLSVITVYDNTVDETLDLTSLTFDGKVYVVADGDLVQGTTTRWDNGIQVVDPDPPALNIGANADNFLFESVFPKWGLQANISSLDVLSYQETVFPFLVSTIFVFERGGNDNGTVQAILSDGTLGAALTLTAGGAPYADTGVASKGQNVFGYALTTDEPVKGLRITASGHDTLSISAPNVNFYPTNPSPADGATVPVGDVDLSWTNADPNNPDDPVYVDVWFGTEPNELDPGYDMTKVVDADPNRTSVTVSAATEGTYYWQVGNYINGNATGDPCEGDVWSFNAVEDLAPSSVDAGVDMITWSGQPVSLDATVVDDGKSALTYAWTADPADGVVFSDPAIEDPTVTITKATLDPSTVTLTLAVNDEGNPTPVEDTMDIDLYDNACKAALGTGLVIDPTDFDANCITDLRDFAVFVSEWLVDNALTAPVPK